MHACNSELLPPGRSILSTSWNYPIISAAMVIGASVTITGKTNQAGVALDVCTRITATCSQGQGAIRTTTFGFAVIVDAALRTLWAPAGVHTRIHRASLVAASFALRVATKVAVKKLLFVFL